MGVYKALTDYLANIEQDSCGEWVIDRKSKGTAEDPIQMPYVSYSRMVQCFIHDAYQFMDDHTEYELTHYSDILRANGIEWGKQSMQEVDVSTRDGRCVMALIIGALRADKFATGALFSIFESGAIERWLLRLKEIDENMKDRIESEARAIVPITNDTLVCKDCVQRYDDSIIFGNVSKCEAFPVRKPNCVLLGGKCAEYVKE